MTSRARQDPEYQLPAVEGIPNGEMGAATDLGQLQKEKQDYKPSNKKIGYLWGSIMKVRGTKEAMAFL